MQKPKSRVITVLIYLIPVLFFIISYFLLTTSGEDVFQGAGNFSNGNFINPLADATQSFLFNSRITDMYSWTVIDFYDYQFSFGIDTLFRVIDVLVALAVFAISPFARPFYEEFSMAHNYPPLILATLLFSIPFLKLILNKPPKNHLKLLCVLMFFLGLYFGMATTVTPIAFLVTLAIYCFARRKDLKSNFKSLPAWFFAGIIGVIIGLFLTQIVFSATNHYVNDSTSVTFDYLALSTIFEQPIASFFSIIKHTLYNFGIVLLPLFALYTFFAFLTKKFRFYFSKQFFKSLPISTRRFYLVCLLFIIIHLFGFTQIIAPYRLLMPPFMIGLILVFRIFENELNSKFLGIMTIIFATAILLVHTVLLAQYHKTAAEVLTEIKQSDTADICVDRARIAPNHIKISNLNQVNLIVDWGFPEIIYGKNITFCKN